jgi:hypothetical protein
MQLKELKKLKKLTKLQGKECTEAILLALCGVQQ